MLLAPFVLKIILALTEHFLVFLSWMLTDLLALPVVPFAVWTAVWEDPLFVFEATPVFLVWVVWYVVSAPFCITLNAFDFKLNNINYRVRGKERHVHPLVDF